MIFIALGHVHAVTVGSLLKAVLCRVARGLKAECVQTAPKKGRRQRIIAIMYVI